MENTDTRITVNLFKKKKKLTDMRVVVVVVLDEMAGLGQN